MNSDQSAVLDLLVKDLDDLVNHSHHGCDVAKLASVRLGISLPLCRLRGVPEKTIRDLFYAAGQRSFQVEAIEKAIANVN